MLNSALTAGTRVVQELDLGNKPKISDSKKINENSEQIVLNNNPKVELLTNKGSIVIELFPDKAPITVKNFLAYVQSGFYNNTVFHRVIKNLLIQGGAYSNTLKIKSDRGYIKSEANNGLSNTRGTIAAARRANDSDSASSQFFFNVVDNQQFDFSSTSTMSSRGYTVFGKIIKGQEIVDAMRLTATTRIDGIGDHVPKSPIIISQARVLE
jgi:peptidyl-prolyl cis-trans isomerase A (cyclophilin A)